MTGSVQYHCHYYPSPTRSVCEGYGSYPEHVYTWEGYGSHSVSYPEHVYTWEGYSSHSVSYPSPTHSVCEDIVVTLLVIPSTCIRGRDMVVTLLVRVSVCVSPVNS